MGMKILAEISSMNWGEKDITENFLSSSTWQITADGYCIYYDTYNLDGVPCHYKAKLSDSLLKYLLLELDDLKSDYGVDACDGTGWKFIRYSEDGSILKEYNGYIYGVEQLEEYISILKKVCNPNISERIEGSPIFEDIVAWYTPEEYMIQITEVVKDSDVMKFKNHYMCSLWTMYADGRCTKEDFYSESGRVSCLSFKISDEDLKYITFSLRRMDRVENKEDDSAKVVFDFRINAPKINDKPAKFYSFEGITKPDINLKIIYKKMLEHVEKRLYSYETIK